MITIRYLTFIIKYDRIIKRGIIYSFTLEDEIFKTATFKGIGTQIYTP